MVSSCLPYKCGIESGPVALKDFSPFRSLWTPFWLTVILDISRCGLGALFGSELVSSFVMTDSK